MFGKLFYLSVATIVLQIRVADAVWSADIVLAPAIGGLAFEATGNVTNIGEGDARVHGEWFSMLSSIRSKADNYSHEFVTLPLPIIYCIPRQALALAEALGEEDLLQVSDVLFISPDVGAILATSISPKTRPHFYVFRRRRRSGSSSSSSSSGSAAPPLVVPVILETPDPTPVGDRIDGHSRQADQADQRTVYLWTFSHTDVVGMAKPGDFSRQSFASLVLSAYAVTSKVVSQWSVFLEVHPSSKSEREQRPHFHMIVETDKPCRWLELARHMRQQNVFASAATSSSRKSYWAAFAYLYVGECTVLLCVCVCVCVYVCVCNAT